MPLESTETEVVDEIPGQPKMYQFPASLPRVQFNIGTTLQSPFFWLLAGALVPVILHAIFSRKK